MEKEFVPYEQALALKELGFDGDCFAIWSGFDEINFSTTDKVRLYSSEFRINDTQSAVYYINDFNSLSRRVAAPTFSQVFRWFREKYNLHHNISILQRSCRYHFKIRTIECESDLKPFGDNKIIFEDGPRKKYEDIELDCLKKLIEIVKDGK